MCGTCHAKFNLRSELFEHLEEKNHVAINEGDVDEHMNRSANIRGAVERSAAATGSSSNCRSTSRRTSKRSAELVIG